jgi:hypothetical protein
MGSPAAEFGLDQQIDLQLRIVMGRARRHQCRHSGGLRFRAGDLCHCACQPLGVWRL